MKKFIFRALLLLGIPFLLLAILYIITDPFKTIRDFSLEYFDITNRDYLSTELFLKNSKCVNYDSFIFGSSRCSGLNSYHWKKYLPDSSKQFVFQAWSETLTGIYQKLNYIDRSGNDIENALLVFDIPGTFSSKQLPTKTLSIKDWRISGQSEFMFQCTLCYNFLQKPSIWLKSIKDCFNNDKPYVSFDTVSNDWDSNNRYADLMTVPMQDSLNNCSNISRKSFMKAVADYKSNVQEISPVLITDDFKFMLIEIKNIFSKHNTAYKIIISPAPWQTNKAINPADYKTLVSIFGNHVFDFSGRNTITEDYNNFTDPGHFGLRAGWTIIEDIYNRN